ncbi:MAG: ornithine carbamoyltransferase, partial [Gaiellaceae bacterium]
MATSTERLTTFRRVGDLDPSSFHSLLELSERMKLDDEFSDALRGRIVACIFEKPSTRTRVSFAAAAARLGATPVTLSPQELQLGRGESIADTARSLSGYCTAIVIRTFAQWTVDELADYATVPVINALSNEHHPCQALADLLTVKEMFGGFAGRRLAFVGDGGDNVAHSLLEACALGGLDLTVACPREYRPQPQVLAEAQSTARRTGTTLRVVDDPADAVRDADVVYADVWASMGEEAEHERRRRILSPYQVTESLMRLARPESIFL